MMTGVSASAGSNGVVVLAGRVLNAPVIASRRVCGCLPTLLPIVPALEGLRE
jgi:hypothetical protein